MKKLKKFIFLAIFICIAYSFSVNFSKVNASESENEIEAEEDMARESLENLEKNLSENNTSVVEELNKLINDYEEMYETETSYEEKEKIENLISSLQKYIEEYNQFSCERQQMKESGLYTVVVPFDPIKRYEEIVTAAIATFKFMKCPLSAELLTHARQNEEVDSLYTPTKGGIILQSTLVQEKANDINIACGSAEIINNGDSISKDLFYAIKFFQYEKIYKDECSIVFHIRDRYDFDEKNEDLEGMLKIAVGTIYACQQAGVITPFITDIAETMPGCVPYTYEFRNQEAIITGVPNYVNSITIPEQMMDVSTYLNKSGATLYNVTTIDDYAFYEANNLKNITIPNTVTNIGQSAFENCSNLTTITLSNALTTMENSIFKGCTSLKSIVLPNTVTSIGQSAFENCSNLTTITLPSTLKTMPNSMFKGCTSLNNIVIPDTLTSIGQSAFENCINLTTITLPFAGGEENNEKSNFFGYIFGAPICSENASYVPGSLKEVILTKGTSIGVSAFQDCSSIENIKLSNAVTSIGQSAFENCSNLTTITLPSALKTMPNSMFKGCTSLSNIAIPNTVTSIGQSTFENCSGLTNLTLPDTLTTMGDLIFKGCTSLNNIVIPDTVTSIGQSVFENCSNLTTITLPSTLKTMPNSMFKGCTSLSNIAIPNTVTSIGQSTFENCSGLTNLTLPDTLTTMGDSMFKGCTSLNNIVIPDTLTSIGQSAFENCSSLTNINLSNQLIEIGSAAFKACINLKNITIPNSVEQINNYAFSNCTKLENVIVLKETSEITNLHQDVFFGCSALQSITVPMNRVAEYKNKDHWSNYATKINPSSTQFDACYIHCLSNLTTSTILEPGHNKLYQIQVECGKSYTITSSGSFTAQISLYDANMKVMSDSSSMMNNNCGTIVGYLSPGIYYLSISFKDNTSSGEINTKYVATWANTGWNVIYNKTNEISNHLHKIADNQYKTQLYYINGKGAGFYEFTLTGIKQDGTEISYPEGAIKIYNNEERTSLIEKYNLTTHNNQASSKEGQNKIIVYLPQDGYYYINICLDTNQIETLQFNIQAVEAQKINLFDLSETTNETIPIFENNNIKMDNIRKVTIQQSGKFTIKFVYDGIQTEDILCILFKQNYNSVNYEYTIETKIIEVMNNENQVKEITLTLDAGTYYIGYFNKNDTQTMSTHLTRIITQYGSHALVPDPDDQTPYGSQIAIAEQDIYLYNRSYRGTNILEGFTRLIYLDDDYAPSVSRLDYDFYTSNESIATVSAYGTVQALNVTKDTNIKIMAVYKKDKSIVFTKTFTIVNDGKTYVSDPIDITINMTIKDGVLTSIKFNNISVPDQMLQHYFWISKDEAMVTVDSYGRLYANSQAIGQTIEIEGAYMYNERVKIKINVTVID